jgi:hypothetical protein
VVTYRRPCWYRERAASVDDESPSGTSMRHAGSVRSQGSEGGNARTKNSPRLAQSASDIVGWIADARPEVVRRRWMLVERITQDPGRGEAGRPTMRFNAGVQDQNGAIARRARGTPVKCASDLR